MIKGFIRFSIHLNHQRSLEDKYRWHPKAGSRTRAPQERALLKREQLLDAAIELLGSESLENISLTDISSRAGIPVGSTYHHFANTGVLFSALAARFAEELDDYLSQPYSGEEASDWQSLVRTAVARAARLYNERADYRQLILGGKAPAEIKLSDRENDEAVGQILADAIGQHFEITDFPRRNEIFFYAVEIADLLFMLSQRRHGEITADMCREAQLAMVTYLRAYLPEQLPRKPA